METKIQRRKLLKKDKTYITRYINIPKQILTDAPWLRKQKIISIEVDLLGHVIITPKQ